MKAKTRVIIGYLFILLGIFMPLLAFTSMSYRELMANKNYASFKARDSQVTDDLIDYNKKVIKGTAILSTPLTMRTMSVLMISRGLTRTRSLPISLSPSLT